MLDHDFESRIDKINLLFSNMRDFVPATKITIHNEIIVYEQEYLKKENYQNLSYNEKLLILTKFVHNLEILSLQNFVHGDINIKNILLSNGKIYLIN